MALDHANSQKAETKILKLPEIIVGSADLRRLVREIEAISDFLVQSKIRSGSDGGKSVQPPHTTQLLDELSKSLELNLLEKTGQDQLKEFLKKAQISAPVVHISFASDPPPQFMGKIVQWFRREIHPMVLLNVGLEPSIAAGCIVRTSSRVFDLSLRSSLMKQQPLLREYLIKGGS